MGIQGLLPFLKKASRPSSLRDFKGKTAVIDAYSWLHKGAFSCADKLVRGEPTNGNKRCCQGATFYSRIGFSCPGFYKGGAPTFKGRYVFYVMKQVSLLLNHDIKPILVFDGCHLPSKAGTENKRREKRERSRKKAKELLREGKIREAKECFQQCVDITSEMASEVISACRARNVDIIVAPYEADSQLAYLNMCGIADLIITEDSDLILFGSKNILFKMDSQGNGVLVQQEKLHLGLSTPRDKFSFDKFRNMCILSGCDYLPSLPGIGLAKACKFFSVTANPNIHNALCKLPSYLKMPQLEVTQEYRDSFIKARNTFLYQLVFDPINRQLRPLTDYPDGMGPEDYPYAGPFVGHERALQIALGNVNVQSGELVGTFDPQNYEPPEMKSSGWEAKGNICSNHQSIWKQDYVPRKVLPFVPSLATSPQESTKGKEMIVPMAAVKRKREIVMEPSTPNISEDELQNMYTMESKKPKVEAALELEHCEENTYEDSAIDWLSESLEEEEETKETSSILLQENKEDDDHEQSNSSHTEVVHKSKNPFAKVQSPKKSALPSGQFSALKRFGKIRKTVVDPHTSVQSRYFSSASSPSPDNSKRKSASNILPLDIKSDAAPLGEKNKCYKVQGQTDCQVSVSPVEIKAPLSPVQTNATTVESERTGKPEKSFKWGKLTNMFSYKGDKKDFEHSPASRNPFKSVITSKSAPCTPILSKENAEVLVQSSDVSSPLCDSSGLETLPLSQKSTLSEMSTTSDVGSIDNESFGLTPTSMVDPGSSQEVCDEHSLSQEGNKVSPVIKNSKSRPAFFDQKPRVNSRPLGLSRPRGKHQKRPDTKQMNLRDMFGFKKEQPKMMSRPSL